MGQRLKKSYQINLKFRDAHPGNIEIIKFTLVAAGFLETDIVESTLHHKSFLSLYFQSKVFANFAYKKISALHLRGVYVRLKTIEVAEWRDKWKKDFKRFPLTKRFDVVPILEKDKRSSSSRTPIYLDTGLAFGTGLHETTRFMVRLMEQVKFDSFFDIGTGTGILAMAAIHLGAIHVDAVDIDEDAVKVAKQNFLVNKLKPRYLQAADITRHSSKQKYDFVAANLVTNDLIRLKWKIWSFVKKNGYLAVSGISLENYRRFRSAFKPFPLKCVRIEKGKEWVAVLFRRF